MTTFVIRTEDGRDLGFLMLADHDGDWPPAGRIDCVFSGFPYDPTLLDDPRGLLVMDNKGQEFSAEVSYSGNEMLLCIATATGWAFELRSDPDGNRWTATRDNMTIDGGGVFL